ncbi:hypothetical protein V8C86DRAFT_2780441 [Haematococcus lacustris]
MQNRFVAHCNIVRMRGVPSPACVFGLLQIALVLGLPLHPDLHATLHVPDKAWMQQLEKDEFDWMASHRPLNSRRRGSSSTQKRRRAASEGNNDNSGPGSSSSVVPGGLEDPGAAFHSLGKVKGFLGDVGSAEEYRKALEACSFKKEIILISASENSIDTAMQLMNSLRQFQLAHTLLVVTKESSCRAAAAHYPFGEPGQPHDLCCVWEHPEVPMTQVGQHAFRVHRYLMHVRVRLAARALRLRYNVLFLDTDVMVFANPYSVLKAPPLQDVNLMYDTGGGAKPDGNIGIMYAQNAAPNGPVAWVFAELPDRNLRWGEQPDFLLHNKRDLVVTRDMHHVMWDQPCFCDAVSSTLAGRPQFTQSWAFHDRPPNTSSWDWPEQQAKAWRGKVRSSKVVTTGFAATLARQYGSSSVKLGWAPMRHPNTNGTWPLELGGQGFPARRANYSLGWLQLLRQQAPDEPLWPDPEQPMPTCTPQLRAEAAQRPQPSSAGCTSPDYDYTEKFAGFPGWVTHAWWSRDRERSDWDVKRQPPTQVLGHVLFMISEKHVYKNGVKMAYGGYNWSLARTVKQHLVNHSDEGWEQHGRTRLFVASTRKKEEPSMLLAHPNLPLAHLSYLQLTVALHHLFTAALILGRALTWPALPCKLLETMAGQHNQLDWARQHREKRRYVGYWTGVVPFPASQQLSTWYQATSTSLTHTPSLPPPALTAGAAAAAAQQRGPSHTVSSHVDRHKLCIWQDIMFDACLSDGKGLMPPEAEHLLQTLQARYNASLADSAAKASMDPRPGSWNTLSLQHDSPAWVQMQKADDVTIRRAAAAAGISPSVVDARRPGWPTLPTPVAGAAASDDEFGAMFVLVTTDELRAAARTLAGGEVPALYLEQIPVVLDMASQKAASRRLQESMLVCRALPGFPHLANYTSTQYQHRE